MATFDLSNQNFNQQGNKNRIIGITIIVICSVAFLVLFTSFLPFLKSFLLGTIGLFAYPSFIVLFSVGIAFINNRRYVMPLKYVAYICAGTISLLAILNLIIIGQPEISFLDYIALSYEQKYTAGGIIIGFLVAPLLYIFGFAASLIIFSITLIVSVALIIDFLNTIKIYGKNSVIKDNTSELKIVEILDNKKQKRETKAEKQQKQTEAKNLNDVISLKDSSFNLFLDKKMEQQKNTEAKRKLGLIKGNLEGEKSPRNKPKTIREILLTPPEIDLSAYGSYRKNKEREINDNINSLKQEKNFNSNISELQKSNILNDFKDLNESDENFKNTIDKLKEQVYESGEIEKEHNENFNKKPKRNFAQLKIDNFENNNSYPKNLYKIPPNYSHPPLDLLENRPDDLDALNEDVVEKRIQLENALRTFGINAHVIGVVVGPSVTRFELEMPPGISVKRIIAHKDDISLALASRAGIRIEAPIPGKSAVGIEVPNNHISTVGLREVVDSDDFLSSKSPVTFALGKDINGCIKTCNLAKMPHLLVAGATNSGKSIFLNALIISMIYKSSPDDLRLILIDPKRVEFSMYSNLPHLVIPNVITETEKASNALTWALNEMERRYEIFETERCRNIEEYNNSPNVISGEEKKLPYIVIVIDEFSDLMSTMKKEIEEKVKRLAQKARASGIHLVLTTQRPSVDVITGTIKTNFPSRISFALTSFADSKTILDQSGAENLLGKGDMLFLPSDANFPVRIQGCFVSNKEVKDVVQYIKENNQQEFDDEAGKEIESLVPNGEINDELSAQKLDPLSIKCLKFVIENGQASISSLQRNFALGFGKAGRIIDNLTKMGYISKQDGMKPRDVYLTMDGFKNLFGDE
ncbi:MAG: DNA translocase FtsK [Clostridia bacterium]|nr:DNA translocase FtsK [Clostridia bacterium]